MFRYGNISFPFLIVLFGKCIVVFCFLNFGLLICYFFLNLDFLKHSTFMWLLPCFVVPFKVGNTIVFQLPKCVYDVCTQRRVDVAGFKFSDSISVLSPVGVIAHSFVLQGSWNRMLREKYKWLYRRLLGITILVLV